jgi:nitrate/nitrite transporter NarK
LLAGMILGDKIGLKAHVWSSFGAEIRTAPMTHTLLDSRHVASPAGARLCPAIGIRRLGSVMGITGVFFTFGAALSPIATGRIFDLTGSYSIPISSFVVLYIICSLAIFGCRPLDLEQMRLEMPARSAAI